jgi:PhzF family phenazine biosynthesis protein
LPISTAHMLTRHFSSPYSGTIKDPVTGTASGGMGAYYANYIMKKDFGMRLDLVVEQGHEIGRDGRVGVTVTKNSGTLGLEILGNAVYVNEFEIS